MSKEMEQPPWEGQLYEDLDAAPAGTRADIQLSVLETLGNDSTAGMATDELAGEVARQAYESTENGPAPYLSGDVVVELGRMKGSLLIERPNKMLFRRIVELNTQ